jgi:hypothetical protein
VAIVCVTLSVNIFVVVSNLSVAVPVAAEALAGTSAAPLKVAAKVMVGSATGGGVSSLSQDVPTVNKVAMAKKLIKRFIIKF